MKSGLIPGGQDLSKRQTVFFTSVDPMNKNTRILIQSTWKHRLLHGTCRQRGRNIKIRCIGSTSILLWRKDWSSVRCDRTPSSFTTHSQPIVSRRLSRWKLEKSHTWKYLRLPGLLRRFPLKTIGWRNWVQKLQTWWKLTTDPTKDHKSNC